VSIPTMSADYLVVGAGSSGAVIASRLSEDPGVSIIVLEAGPHYSSEQATPAHILDGRAPSMMLHDWGREAQTVDGNRIPYSRGKISGGSSATNGAIALRGDPDDFDHWAELGNPGWSWPHMLEAFRRLETDRDFDEDYHGHSGPIPIVRATEDQWVPFAQGFHSAAVALGFAATPDHNSPSSSGIGPIPMNIREWTRVSTAIAYLLPVQERPNLTIIDNAEVRTVRLIGRRACGVTAQRSGEQIEVTAGNVIIAAGAIESPALLLRSGIGPASALSALGRQCFVDLPGVGANLCEHPSALVMFAPSEGAVQPSDPLTQVMLRCSTGRQKNDIQLFALNNFSLPGAESLRRLAGRDRVSAIGTSLQLPLSRGRVMLNPADPESAPQIDLNFFDDSTDMARMMFAYRLALQLAASDQVQDVVSETLFPPPDAEDDTALAAFLRQTSVGHLHASGTCRMGPASETESVVDPQLRVLGVDGLMVADASIMPSIVRANTNLTAIAIAERAVQLINGQNSRLS
jgi:choline dehydrogenase